MAIVWLTANSGSEALDLLGKTDTLVRLIISDQRMPHMTGAEFLEKTRDIFPYALRFLLTAHMDMEDLVAAVNKGRIHQYISKPWDDRDMRRRIRETLVEQDRFLKNARSHHLSPRERRGCLQFNEQLVKSLSMMDDTFQLNLGD